MAWNTCVALNEHIALNALYACITLNIIDALLALNGGMALNSCMALIAGIVRNTRFTHFSCKSIPE